MNGKQKFYFYLAIVQVILILVFLLTINGLVGFVNAQTETTFDYYNSPTTPILAISAAIAISVSGLAAAHVIKTVGTAAISAISEREGAFGKVVVIYVNLSQLLYLIKMVSINMKKSMGRLIQNILRIMTA